MLPIHIDDIVSIHIYEPRTTHWKENRNHLSYLAYQCAGWYEHEMKTDRDESLVLSVKTDTLVFLNHRDFYCVQEKQHGYSIVAAMRLSGELPSIVMDCGQDTSVLPLFQELLNYRKQICLSNVCYASGIIYGIFGKIYQYREMQTLWQPSEKTVMLAKRYIQEHYDDTALTGERVSETVGMSLHNLNRLFRQNGETSVWKYMLACRIDEAKRLLDTTVYSVSHIAELTGFHDVYYFSRFFHEKVGLSPSDYRKRGLPPDVPTATLPAATFAADKPV